MTTTRAVLVALAIAVLLPGRNHPLGAQAPDLFGPVEGPSAPVPATGQTLRSRPVSARLDQFDQRGILDAASRSDRALTLNLFADATFAAVLESVEILSATEFIWKGRVNGQDNTTVTLVVNGEVLVGEVRTPTTLYEIRPIRGGGHFVRQIDPSQYPASLEPLIPPAQAAGVEADARVQGDDGLTVDVLVVWTPAAELAAGGLAAMNALVNLAITNTNTSYANSGVLQRVRLMHKESIAYVEAGGGAGGFTTDLGRLKETADGFMDTVHALRDAKGADLVGLIIDNVASCGLGYLMSGAGQPSATFAPFGFSVNYWDCIGGNVTLGHEMGHNQGLGHNGAGESSLYSYSHGYSEPGGTFRTVMAISSPVPRVFQFSNPAVTYTGLATGVVGSSENARTLNETALVTSNYRQSLVQDIFVGLGPTGGGYAENLRAVSPHDHLAWNQVSWAAYNTANGETRPALCQLDADEKLEVVLGLGPYPGAATGGYLQVKDDSSTGYAHLAWLRLDWPGYNTANGETFPACGDLDTDGKDEIVIGLGFGGGGFIKVLEDAAAGFANQFATPGGSGWLQVGWAAYNTNGLAGGNGATHPAVGNLDADIWDEIAIGYGTGASGYVKLLDHSVTFYAPMPATPGGGGWIQLGWAAYNAGIGAIWPAIGDLNSDAKGELALGVQGTAGAGWVQIRGDNSTSFAAAPGTPTAGGWVQVNWAAYNAAVGTTYPAIGDMDGDLRNELVIGLGTYTADGGWFEVKDDLVTGLPSKSWGRIKWVAYNASDGTTRPALYAK